ncbi:unnamed protein product [Angiostrongylus costaricensis]|uniref:SHSP domain-containing protein n=1 Tax=Angiostrongylus costaricensis TaxID=334426 RepID=A0A0R3PWD1_ANGCS|nr:unnamed protein product [Angiostrongylus costaricensis]
MSRTMERMMDEYMRAMAMHVGQFSQLWKDTDDSMLKIANEAHQVVNDDKKFAVSIDVSQFKPEELKVNLDGRMLTVEGKQECRNDTSYMTRSFVRSWTLPNDVDTDAIQTELNDQGKLTIKAAKNGSTVSKKSIPIEPRKSRPH